ncbi:MAG TPA: hypothetical protein VMU62_00215 [Acidobacteriaceae bacterium]|nr:hypothetical protein [Acidobacteriaceae bacterium]
MMLWFRAWLETRTRFLICLAGILFLCLFSVFPYEKQAGHWVVRSYYNYVLLNAHLMLVVMWVLTVTLLMMGGLLREEALGSASFTLALPVSRQRLMAVRIATGAFQAVTLAIAPWCAMYLIAITLGKTYYSLSQVAFHLLLLLTGGAVFFAIALLVSSVVSGEYTAPLVSFGAALAIATMLSGKIQIFSPFAFIMGTEYIDWHTYLLVGPFPWAEAAIRLFLAALLTWIAVRIISKRDF